MRIRAAEPRDDAALLRIDEATWTSTVSPVAPPRERPSFFASTTADQFLVADAGERVIGFVSLGRHIQVPANEHVLELKSLAVDPDRQRGGVGRLLVQAAVEATRARGARRLVLRVLGWNSSARRLYERCGFGVEGIFREQFVLDGRYVGDIFMALDLTADERQRPST